jgi:DNA-binding winged helix-turn-helix (wHTH) protein
VQHEPLQGKVDAGLALTSQKMADTNDTSNPQTQTANPPRVPPDGTTGIISFGPYKLIATLRRLECAGRPVPLGDREFDLLCTLTAHAGEVVGHRELKTSAGGNPDVGKGRLTVHINALRKALSQNGVEIQYIGKVARRGYVFTAPISRSTTGDGEGSYPLWEGRIIDATFPQE